MRILILNQSFHPDVVSVAQHAKDLAATLVEAGHSVTVLASRHGYMNPKEMYPAREEFSGCSVRRVSSPGLGKHRAWRRVIDSLALLMRYWLELMRMPRFDVIIAMTHPPLISTVAAFAALLKGGAIVSWIMDLNPDEAIAAGWLRPDSAMAAILSGALRFGLRRSCRIVVLDRFMRDRMLAKGVPEERLEVLPPWSHDHSVRYDRPGRDALRREWGLDGKFVVMYSGNMTPVHPLDTVVEAARRLRGRSDIVFCFVGGGNALPAIRAFAEENALANILTFPYQPLDRLSASLSAADLHLVVMGEAMVGIVHPCKVYNILATGVPFVHVGPMVNHVSDIIAALPTPGAAWSVTHGDPDALIRVVIAAAERRMDPLPEVVAYSKRFAVAPLTRRMLQVVEEAHQSHPDGGLERRSLGRKLLACVIPGQRADDNPIV